MMRCLLFFIGLVGAVIIPNPEEPQPIDEPPLATFSLDELNNPPGPAPMGKNTEANVTANDEGDMSRKRVRVHHSKKNANDREPEVLKKKCNDGHLGAIMEASITPSPSTSKMLISERASRDYGTVFDVICARSHISYYVEASNYCEVTVGGITCFAYRSSAASRVVAAAAVERV